MLHDLHHVPVVLHGKDMPKAPLYPGFLFATALEVIRLLHLGSDIGDARLLAPRPVART